MICPGCFLAAMKVELRNERGNKSFTAAADIDTIKH